MERVNLLPFQKVVDEVIIVEPRLRLMHSLNEVGSDIWNLLAKPRTAEEIIRVIAEQYEVDDKTVYEDIIRFLEELLTKNLIRIC